MRSALTLTAALLGFTAVAFGAFGAHGLEENLSVQALEWWETATFYLLIHAVAAFAIGLSGRVGLMAFGGWSLAMGGLIFGATLYGLALGAPSLLGAVTPIGGVLMLVGWASCGISAYKEENT